MITTREKTQPPKARRRQLDIAVVCRRRLPSRVRETATEHIVASAAEPVAAVTPCCFVCGRGAEAGTLEGSGHAGDWVHAACLTQPMDW